MQDKTLRQNEVTALRKQIEKEYLERVKLEDEILEKIRSQLTVDKAAKYTNKLVGKTRMSTKDLVSSEQYFRYETKQELCLYSLVVCDEQNR